MKRKLFYTTLLVVMLFLTIFVRPAQAGETWLSTPVVGAARCGVPFGAPNPIGGQPFHNAVDMACGMYRAPVLAVASGEVVWASQWPIGSTSNMGHGTTVVIRHQDGLFTYSAHLDEANVQVGQLVDQGSIVGRVGNTGYVDKQYGPNHHLHFAVRNTGPQDGACWDLSCWLDPDDYLGKNQEIPNPDPPSPSSNNIIAKIDEIIAIIKYVPGFTDWDEKWAEIRPFVPLIPCVLAVLTMLVLMGIYWLFKPVISLIKNSRWGRKRYKNAELFWLALSIKMFGQGPYWAQLADFLIAAWGFYLAEEVVEKLWRHFNYDREVKPGGPGKREWLRKMINTMFNIVIIVSLLAYSWGFFLMDYDFQEIIDFLKWFADPDSPDPPNPPDPPDPPDPPNPPDSPDITFDCNFNAIKAGLGPVEVSCDELGLPVFPILWWNGQRFNFDIPPEIWAAALAAGDTPEQVLGIIAIGSSESTEFTNYLSENEAGALGVWQFLPATYSHWAEPGYEDPSYRTNIPIAAKAVGNMAEIGMREIYLMNRSEFTSCFMGGSGCWTWNQHAAQADYAYRILFALKVAAGIVN